MTAFPAIADNRSADTQSADVQSEVAVEPQRADALRDAGQFPPPSADARALQRKLADDLLLAPPKPVARWSARRTLAFMATFCAVFWTGLFYGLNLAFA